VNGFTCLRGMENQNSEEREDREKGGACLPMMKASPTLTDGTRPRDPTRAAAPSLKSSTGRKISFEPRGYEKVTNSRDDVTVKVRANKSRKLLGFTEQTKAK